MKNVIFVVFFALIALVKSQVNQAYGPPSSHHPNGNYGNSGSAYENPENSHGNYEEPQSYEFGYRVKDDYSGSNFHQQEQSDGNEVRGEYRVALPDGRTQIVTYWADWKSGFHADVRYEGEATYPENNNHQNFGSSSNHNNYINNINTEYGVPH